MGERERGLMEKIRLLIADDNPEIRLDIHRYLRDTEDIEVCALCSNGKSALEAIYREKPDVVLLDIIMAGMDGIDVLMALKENPPEKKPRIIMVCAMGLESIARSAIRVGADFYVLKPLDLDFLAAKIRILAQKSRQNQPEEATSQKWGDAERVIRKKLMDIGIPTHTVGYKYLVDALILYIETDGTLSATKHLYPMVADKYYTSAANVERGIRNTLSIYADISMRYGNKEFHKLGFDKRKMANMAMISHLAELIKLETNW